MLRIKGCMACTSTRPHADSTPHIFSPSRACNVLPWPSMSRDLNPNKHTWNELERRVRGRMNTLANVREFFQALKQEWVVIPAQVWSNPCLRDAGQLLILEDTHSTYVRVTQSQNTDCEFFLEREEWKNHELWPDTIAQWIMMKLFFGWIFKHQFNSKANQIYVSCFEQYISIWRDPLTRETTPMRDHSDEKPHRSETTPMRDHPDERHTDQRPPRWWDRPDERPHRWETTPMMRPPRWWDRPDDETAPMRDHPDERPHRSETSPMRDHTDQRPPRWWDHLRRHQAGRA